MPRAARHMGQDRPLSVWGLYHDTDAASELFYEIIHAVILWQGLPIHVANNYKESLVCAALGAQPSCVGDDIAPEQCYCKLSSRTQDPLIALQEY